MPDYVVIIGASHEDGEALQAATGLLDDSRVTLVVQEDVALQARLSDTALVSGEAGFAGVRTTVHIEAEGPTAGAAIAEAREIYGALRARAGLDAGNAREPVTATRRNPLLFLHPRSNTFFSVAERMYNDGNMPYAVIATQTGFELFMEGAFDYVLQLRSSNEIGTAVAQLIRSYNMNDARTRRVWEALTGHRFTLPDSIWQAYQDHLRRRNGLVHRGEGLSGHDAEASLNAINALAESVAGVIRKLQP